MLPTAEVVAYTGTKRQIRKKMKEDGVDPRRGGVRERIKKWRNRKKQ